MNNIFSLRFKELLDNSDLTIEEIAERLNVTKGTISKYSSGDIKNVKRETIVKIAELFNVSAVWLSGFSENKISLERKAIKIPVLGKIPAGMPLEAIEDILDYEEISEEQLKGNKTYFALQIEGNSMEPKYHSKDVLIVLKQDNCESGQDAVVMVNGYDATFKRIIKTESGIMLQPINPEYPPVFYDNQQVISLPVKILGVPVEIRRKLN